METLFGLAEPSSTPTRQTLTAEALGDGHGEGAIRDDGKKADGKLSS
jgi:hypothetical protein